MAAACLLACSLVFAGAAGAHADATKAPWETGAPENGSLTIKKLKDGETAETPVKGAEFTVKKVNGFGGKEGALDLKKSQDWKKLAAKVDGLNNGTITPTFDTTSEKKKETTDNGEAKFENLAIGIYQVMESKVPAGYSSDVKPFYITIPQITGTNTNTTKYEYDVTVKPKNKDVTSLIKKTADTSKTVVAGDDISYTIEAGVNKNKAGNNNVDLTKDDLIDYAVFDDAPTDAFDSISEDNVKKVMVDGEELTKGTHYTIAKEDKENNVTRLTVKFNDAGLTKIAQKVNAKAESKVTVNLTFTIKSSITSNEFTNKSGFVPGHGKNEPKSPEVVPTKPEGGEDPNPKTVLRNFQIMKVSAKDGTTPLKNAKFKLFSSKDDAEKCAKDTTQCNAASKFGEKPTDAKGMTEKVKAIVGQEFYVVETEAPDKYARSNEVTKVKILENNADDPYVVTIENLPKADSGLWFNLPKTGATGVIIFALAGLALVGVGTGMYLRTKKNS
ncbi:Fimbrial subunit type 1 precursor [Chlamydia trachomatis]|nr:Fimbrial subunit type 1 precursor [Chlamydia trachomatis]